MDTKPTTLAFDTLMLAVSMCGSQAEFARRIGSNPQAVWQWINRDKRASVEACPFIERALKDERITCENLRPDYRGFEILRESRIAEI
jgi:DNA-binding transcriptional regulator YdaS (Cro superfamily)